MRGCISSCVFPTWILGMMHSGGRHFNDIDGLELPNIEAARVQAIGLARNSMRAYSQSSRTGLGGRSIHLSLSPQ